MPVTNQTHIARRVRHSQTVTPSSVSAARSWLLAPNSAQKVRHTGIGLPAASSGGWDEEKYKRHAGRGEGADPFSGRVVQTKQFLNDVPPQPRADIERVVDEGREGHQGERDGQSVEGIPSGSSIPPMPSP